MSVCDPFTDDRCTNAAPCTGCPNRDHGDGLRARVETLTVENDLLRDQVHRLRLELRHARQLPTDGAHGG